MATLTETAYLTRKTVNIGVVVVVALIVLKLIFGVAVGIWRTIFPPPPPPATVAFGKLPYPSAENNVATPSGAITYSLETAGGALPAMPNDMKVYFMPRPGPAFGTFERMKGQATKMGFTGIPNKVSSTAWRFTDPNTPLRVLDIDEISGNFRLTYNYVSDQALFTQKNFSSNEALITQAKSFFAGQSLSAQDLDAGQPNVSFFRFDSGTLVSASSLSNADAVSVSFNRADIDKIPVVPPDPKQGLVSVLLSGSGDQKKQALEARYFYTPVDLENFATYPVISASVAFEQLKSGQAFYGSIPNPPSAKITIRSVYMAYLDPYPPQSYLQPVLVFSDEKGFVAYVPVISSDWLVRQ